MSTSSVGTAYIVDLPIAVPLLLWVDVEVLRMASVVDTAVEILVFVFGVRLLLLNSILVRLAAVLNRLSPLRLVSDVRTAPNSRRTPLPLSTDTA